MRIRNVHERALAASAREIGLLVDGLSGPEDRLWPRDRWPAMRLDGPLRPGARGGHGPVRYAVSEHVPGRRVAFRFEGKGLTAAFRGGHWFEVEEGRGRVVLRHVLDARCGLAAWIRWHLAVRPMHDALIEDALDRAQEATGGRPTPRARWSRWVRFPRHRVTARPRPAAPGTGR